MAAVPGGAGSVPELVGSSLLCQRPESVQGHLYALTFLAPAIGIGASADGKLLIRTIVETFPGLRLVNGVPLVLIVVVAAMTLVVDLPGGVVFDFDVSTIYRSVFKKLDQMVAEMEELRS